MGAGADTVLVGHSSGACAALRLVETTRLHAVVAVSLTDNDLGMESERVSGWYDGPWQWAAMRRNAAHIVQFASTDDPFIPLAVQRSVRDDLAAAGSGGGGGGTFEYVELARRSHFFGEEQPEIAAAVLRLCRS
jgi:predicted alpha/beta hydrolase family esterase